ncbi:MAG: ATP-dependent nuclease [Janthinobacterium lividum]
MLLRPIAFRIKNYKSIADSGICTFSGDGVTVLAGQNEAGKTSILEALEDFDGLHGVPPQLDDVVPDQNPTLRPRVSVCFSFFWGDLKAALIKTHIALEPPIVDALHSGAVWLKRDLLTGEFEFGAELAGILEEVELAYETSEEGPDPYGSPALEWGDQAEYVSTEALFKSFYKSWPTFVYFDSFDDLLPRRVSIDPVSRLVGTVTKIEEPDITSAARNLLKVAGIDLKEVRRLAALDDDEKQLRNYLDGRSRELTSDFLDYWKQKVGEKQRIGLKVVYSFKASGASLLFYAEDAGVLHFPSQRSKGFLWFLSFYLSLAASVEPDISRVGQLILIDEPGSFLHPKAQHDILDVLQRRIVNDGDVVMYSTHSPYLLPADRLDRVRVVFKDNVNSTVVAERLNDERLKGELRGDALAPIWNAIGIELGEFGLGSAAVSERELLIVEGITDYYYLHAWARVLDHDLLTNRRILVANGTPMVPYSVSLALTYAKTFAVLLDRDDAGNSAADKLRREMNINAHSIVQPQDALGIEDIFQLEDFKNLLSAYGASPKIEGTAKPTGVVKRAKLDKVLLARKFSELVSTGAVRRENLKTETVSAAKSLLDSLLEAFLVDPVHRV